MLFGAVTHGAITTCDYDLRLRPAIATRDHDPDYDDYDLFSIGSK